jgi:uncharacterized repeat protein (TIGR02543 family)
MKKKVLLLMGLVVFFFSFSPLVQAEGTTSSSSSNSELLTPPISDNMDDYSSSDSPSKTMSEAKKEEARKDLDNYTSYMYVNDKGIITPSMNAGLQTFFVRSQFFVTKTIYRFVNFVNQGLNGNSVISTWRTALFDTAKSIYSKFMTPELIPVVAIGLISTLLYYFLHKRMMEGLRKVFLVIVMTTFFVYGGNSLVEKVHGAMNDVTTSVVKTISVAGVSSTDKNDLFTTMVKVPFLYLTQVSGTIIMPAGGLTLKAKWEETDQVIRFDANGGTGVDSIVAKTNATIMMEEFTTTRDGYEFIGWFDTNDQQVTGEFIVPAGGATFIAKWQALDQTITFDVNGGDSATQPEAIVQPTDTKVKLDEVAKPKKSGYTFAGWADKTGKKYAGTITMPAGGLTLLAQWEEEPAAPVTKPKDNTSTNNNGNNNYKTNQTLSKKQSTEKSLPNSGEKTSPVIELIGLVVMFGVLALVVLQRSQKLNNKK